MEGKVKKILLALVLTSLLVRFTYGNDEDIFKVGIGAFKDELYMVAESQFKTIVEQYPNSRYFQDSIYYLLLSQYFQKKYGDALKTASLIEGRYKYIKYFPKVVYIKGKIFFETSDYRNAIRSFESYLKSYPIDEDAPYSAYYMAMSYYYLTNNQRAIEILEKLENEYPNAPIIEDVRFRISKIYFESGDLDKSYMKFKDFEKLYPNSKYIPEVFYTIGKILFQKGNSPNVQTNLIYDSAMYFQKSSQIQSPLKPYAMFNSGVSFLLIGKYESAIDSFNKLVDEFSISSDPNIKDMVNEAVYNLAKTYQKLGDYENSAKFYRMSISQGGKFSIKSVVELSDLLTSQGKIDDATVILSQYTNDYEVLLKYSLVIQDKNPEESEKILFSLATSTDVDKDVKNSAIVEFLKLSLKKGKYDVVINNFKTLLDNSSDDFTTSFIYFALGEANLNLRDYKSAISSYSQVINESLKEDAIEGIAYSHYLSENYNLAIKFYSDLLTIYKSQKYRDRANYMIAVCYEKLKKNNEAKNYYLKLIETGIDKKYILPGVMNLGWIYVKEKEYDSAISLVSKYIDSDPSFYEYFSEILAWAYDGKGDYTKAISTLRNVVVLKEISDLQKVRYYNYISLFYEKAGDLSGAVNVIEKELLVLTKQKSLTNHTVEAIGRIIDILVKLKDDKKLVVWVSELKQNYISIQKSYEYLYRYAEYLYSGGRYDEAGKEFLFIAKNSQDKTLSDEAYFWAGWSYYNAKKIDEAVSIFDEFVNVSFGSRVPSVLLVLGDIMVNKKEFSEARNYYQRIVDQFKNSPEYNDAVIRLSRISSVASADEKKVSSSKDSNNTQSKGQDQKQQIIQPQQPQVVQQQPTQKSIDEIISSLESVSKSKDKDTSSKAKFELAMIYKSQRNYQKAIELLQEITEEVYNETSAMAQFEIGEILRINGDYNKAWKEYIKVIYIYKDYKDIVVKAMYYTILCYIQIKEYDQAKKLYEKMVKDFYKNTWTEEARKLIEKL